MSAHTRTATGPQAEGAEVEAEIPARAPWSAVVPAGAVLTLTDLHGNQAVDFLVYDAHDTSVRYSAPDTVQAQGGIFLTTGSVLLSGEHTPLMTVIADTCGRHDTIGGACSKESNTLRYGHHTWSQHACVDNFLTEGARWGLGKRDLVSNVNWFMNVPVEEDGTLGIVDVISAPGLQVALRAETDVLVLVSNCPQINNPCNGFDPTPVRVTVTASAARKAPAQDATAQDATAQDTAEAVRA
jgi:urea carboxylase-associated protein 1